MSYRSVPEESPTREPFHKSVPHVSPHKSVPHVPPHKSVPQEFATRVSHKSIPQEFATRGVSYKCRARVTHKSILRVSHRVSYKSDPHKCRARVSRDIRVKRVPQECPTRVSHKSVRQERSTRVSKCPTRVSYKRIHQTFLQECPTMVSPRVSHTVSYKSVPQESKVSPSISLSVRAGQHAWRSTCVSGSVRSRS